MGKTILFVHGRSFKPNKRAIWSSAVEHGISRDRKGKLRAFKRAKKEFVCYGDISNPLLRSRGQKYSEKQDITDWL